MKYKVTKDISPQFLFLPFITAVAALLLSTGLQAEPSGPRQANVDARRILAADDEPGNWMSHGRTYDEQRYSLLTQINEKNIDRLGLSWRYDFDTHRGLEATPIVVDGVMYVSGSWSRVYAFDAASGKLLWQYNPQVPPEWAVNLCCDVVNRGGAPVME